MWVRVWWAPGRWGYKPLAVRARVHCNWIVELVTEVGEVNAAVWQLIMGLSGWWGSRGHAHRACQGSSWRQPYLPLV